jgi:Xaa-Pro aminopeptidase
MMDSDARLGSLRRKLAEEGVDALLVTDASDQHWVTGFDGVLDDDPGTVALVTEHSARLYADSRYVTAAAAAAEGTQWRVHKASRPAKEALEAFTGPPGGETIPGGSRIALQATLPWGVYTRLAEPLGERVVPERGWIGGLRMIKDEHEIERIARAQEITDRAFDHVLTVLATGLSEREVALEIEVFMRRNGSDGVAFAPIVASGPDSALPHAQPGGRILADGDLVVLDFGASVGGYCADMTRTVVIGTASDRQRAIYEAVREANAAGTEAVRAMAKGPDVHAAAVDVLEQHGLGDKFGHGLGHGVGLDIHEGPSLSPRSEDSLAPGMVVTVEPGVYEPGFGGVRIEDLVVVEEAGHRVLTCSPRELIEIRGR